MYAISRITAFIVNMLSMMKIVIIPFNLPASIRTPCTYATDTESSLFGDGKNEKRYIVSGPG